MSSVLVPGVTVSAATHLANIHIVVGVSNGLKTLVQWRRTRAAARLRSRVVSHAAKKRIVLEAGTRWKGSAW